MIHELKTIPQYFNDVLSGEKSFEVRKFDRPFHKGDMLALNEFNPKTKSYTGRSCLVYIDYILNDPAYCKEGYAILAIKPCVVHRITAPRDEFRINGANYSVPLATKGDDNE